MSTWQERRYEAALEYFKKRTPWIKSPNDGEMDYHEKLLIEGRTETGTAFQAGWNACREDEGVKKLVEALESWAKYEQDEIKRIGPYTASSKIPGFIERAEKAIADWKGEE